MNKYDTRITFTNFLRLHTFSFLDGCQLFHKIALTSKYIRSKLPESGLLDQNKVITLLPPYYYSQKTIPESFFKYACHLADSIQVQVEKEDVEHA